MEPYSVERRRVGRVGDKKPLTLAIVVGIVLVIVGLALSEGFDRKILKRGN